MKTVIDVIGFKESVEFVTPKMRIDVLNVEELFLIKQLLTEFDEIIYKYPENEATLKLIGEHLLFFQRKRLLYFFSQKDYLPLGLLVQTLTNQESPKKENRLKEDLHFK